MKEGFGYVAGSSEYINVEVMVEGDTHKVGRYEAGVVLTHRYTFPLLCPDLEASKTIWVAGRPRYLLRLVDTYPMS